MRQAFTAAELGKLRDRPHQALYYAAVHQPRIVWAGPLSDVPTTYPGSAVVATGSTSGQFSAILDGMTLRIGSSYGLDDRGTIRVRRAPLSGSIIGTAEFGSGLINWKAGTCLAVVEEYRLWPIHHSYATATSEWFVDLETYNSQTKLYGPMVLMGPPAVVWLDGGKGVASYVGDRSYSLTPAASITASTILWQFPNGNTVTSLLGSSANPVAITYLNASSGGAYHSLQMADNSGVSHIGHRLTFAFNASNALPPRVYFDNISGGLRDGGYSTRLFVYGDNGGSDQFPEGAQIVIFERASYAGAASSIGGNYPFRNNIVMVGWIQQDSTRIDPFTGELSFAVETIDGELKRAHGYDLFLEGGSAPSAWDMASGITLDRAAAILAKYRSTLAKMTDVNLAGEAASQLEIPFRSLPEGTLWDQLVYNYDALFGIVAADLQSSIYAQLDSQVTGGSGALPMVMSINKEDRRDSVLIDHDHRDADSQEIIYAVRGGTYDPLGAWSPGDRAGYFGGRQEISQNKVVLDQDTLITYAGNIRAANNNPYKTVRVPLSGNIRLDSVPQSRVTMSLSATDQNNKRKLNWNNKGFLPTRTSINYDAKSGYVNTEIEMEAIVNGAGGSAFTFPREIVTVGEDPPPPPIDQPAEGGLAYVITESKIGRTRSFLGTYPPWEDITGAVTGTITDFILDPYDPADTAYCAATTKIFKTTNLNDTSPTWTKVYDLADVGANYLSVTRLRATIAIQNRIYAKVRYDPSPGDYQWHMAKTSNGGTSWSIGDTGARTSDVSGPTRPEYSFWVGQHDGNIIYVQDRGGQAARRSGNGGTSWVNALNAPGDFYGGSDLMLPYSGNPLDDIFFMWEGGTSTHYLRKFTYDRTALTFTTEILTTQFQREVDLVNNVKQRDTIAISTWNGSEIIYASPDRGTVWYSGDGGATWQLRSNSLSGLQGMGLWPYDPLRVFFLQADQINYSTDGFANIQNKTGDWATVMGGAFANPVEIVPVWTE